MHIGVMGGTFDPIHIGHLIAAEQARDRMALDEVWFMPAYRPPHKASAPIADAAHRLNMVRLAIADAAPHFRLCLHEYEREGVSYTYNTALELAERHPQCRFSWIIGADMVRFLPQWYNIGKLVQIVSFIGLPRPGYTAAEAELPDAIRGAVRMADMPVLDISSTEIRSMIAAGRSIRYLVPEAVYEYIKENRLYEAQ